MDMEAELRRIHDNIVLVDRDLADRVDAYNRAILPYLEEAMKACDDAHISGFEKDNERTARLQRERAAGLTDISFAARTYPLSATLPGLAFIGGDLYDTPRLDPITVRNHIHMADDVRFPDELKHIRQYRQGVEADLRFFVSQMRPHWNDAVYPDAAKNTPMAKAALTLLAGEIEKGYGLAQEFAEKRDAVREATLSRRTVVESADDRALREMQERIAARLKGPGTSGPSTPIR